MKERKDPFTGEIFIPKRMNQIYANRKNQIACNNSKAFNKRQENKNTNNVLNKNYETLKRILGDKKEVNVSTDFLRGAQFDFKYFTNYSTTPDKLPRYHIFNYCLINLGNNNHKIVKNV